MSANITSMNTCFQQIACKHKTGICLFVFLLTTLSLCAQTFTSRLTRYQVGEGVVTLHHDAHIDALVNATPLPSTGTANPLRISIATSDSTDIVDSLAFTPTRRVRTTGYRIQVYAGGNNRNAKAEAFRMGNLVRSQFPGVNVYTHFISPRWICRVGDFRTNEEARELLKMMRQNHQFREASIVKSQIIAYQ
ncbi:MAG: SPOR domain-containing protein [Bacteroidales bacterium]|nr:SPOR domain-containing protein [Bacteroidales bacterium]